MPPGAATGTDGGVLLIESPTAALELYPLAAAGGGRAALFDGDTTEADRALAALAAPILVLDEIDAGTGARLGGSVGRMLHSVAANSGQVLCVSHVPQVCSAPMHARAHICAPCTCASLRHTVACLLGSPVLRHLVLTPSLTPGQGLQIDLHCLLSMEGLVRQAVPSSRALSHTA